MLYSLLELKGFSEARLCLHPGNLGSNELFDVGLLWRRRMIVDPSSSLPRLGCFMERIKLYYYLLQLSVLCILLLEGPFHLLDHPCQLINHPVIVSGNSNNISNVVSFLLEMMDQRWSKSFRSGIHHVLTQYV